MGHDAVPILAARDTPPLVSFLRTLPLPTTHPSHPAAPGILETLKDAQRGYADMRGVWSLKCLESQGKHVIGRADTIDTIAAGKEFGKWVELVLTISEDEYQLLTQLTPMASPAFLASSFGTLMAPILTLFSTTLASLVALIKKLLHKYNFRALSAYESLLNYQSHWDDLLARRGPESRKDSNELKDGLHTLRAVCLRSFPEFLADLKFGAMGKGGEFLVTTGLVDFAISTIEYMESLPQVQTAVGSALVTLGDGNWKMGEGVQVGKAAKVGEINESLILEHFVYDVVTTAINSLNTLSRTLRRPAIASIFHLNNISYLRHNLISSLGSRFEPPFADIHPATIPFPLNTHYGLFVVSHTA